MRNSRANEGRCLVVGCVAVLVVAVLIAVAVGIAYSKFGKLVEQYTDGTPAELPSTEMAQADVDVLFARVDEYRSALEAGEASEPLELTQDDLNVLIQHDDSLAFFRGKLYLTLDDDRLGGEVSIPLDKLPIPVPIPGASGRYFNGTASFDVMFRDGRLTVHLESASLKGEPLPEQFVKEIRAKNLAEDWQQNGGQELQELRKYVETVEVSESLLIITPK